MAWSHLWCRPRQVAVKTDKRMAVRSGVIVSSFLVLHARYHLAVCRFSHLLLLVLRLGLGCS